MWQVNGMNLIMQGIDSPDTTKRSGSGAESTLIVPGKFMYTGASVVCRYGQNISAPAFLTILGTQHCILRFLLNVFFVYRFFNPSQTHKHFT